MSGATVLALPHEGVLRLRARAHIRRGLDRHRGENLAYGRHLNLSHRRNLAHEPNSPHLACEGQTRA